MSEEAQPVQVEQPTSEPENGSPAEVVEDTRPAWVRALDEVPAEELRKHDRISGIVGSEKQAWQTQWDATQRSAIEAQARVDADAALEEAEAELDELYDKNPLTFADNVQNKRLIERQQKRVSKLQTDAIQTVSRRFGAAYHALPEFQQLLNDPQEFAGLVQAIQGKSDDEVALAWHTAVTDGAARIRANNLAEARLSERIVKEKAAWEEEAAARGLVTSTRPDISRGGRTATLDPEPNPNTPAWDRWYERTTPGAKRTARG